MKKWLWWILGGIVVLYLYVKYRASAALSNSQAESAGNVPYAQPVSNAGTATGIPPSYLQGAQDALSALSNIPGASGLTDYLGSLLPGEAPLGTAQPSIGFFTGGASGLGGGLNIANPLGSAVSAVANALGGKGNANNASATATASQGSAPNNTATQEEENQDDYGTLDTSSGVTLPATPGTTLLDIGGTEVPFASNDVIGAPISANPISNGGGADIYNPNLDLSSNYGLQFPTDQLSLTPVTAQAVASPSYEDTGDDFIDSFSDDDSGD